MYIASQEGHYQYVDLLLQSKADPDIQTENGVTALNIATHNRHHQCVNLLLQSKTNLHIQANDCITPLIKAISNNDHQIVMMLLKHNADPNAITYHSSPLSFACWHGHLSIVYLLLQYGALVEIQGSIPSILVAVYESRYDIVKVLINAGANVNVQYGFNVTTPLMVASGRGDLHMVELLLQSGADISVKNKYGYTAYDAAVATEHHDIITLLACKIYDQAQEHLSPSEASKSPEITKDDDISQLSDMIESHSHIKTDSQQTHQSNNDSEAVSQQHPVEHTDRHTKKEAINSIINSLQASLQANYKFSTKNIELMFKNQVVIVAPSA